MLLAKCHQLGEGILHSSGSLIAHIGKHVRVGVEGYGDRGVSQHLLNDLRMNSLG